MKYLSTIENVEAAAKLLAEIASHDRLSILYRLSDVEASLDVLAAELGIKLPTLASHMTKLHELGLVHERVDAQIVYYRCDDAAVNKLLRVVAEIYLGERAR